MACGGGLSGLMMCAAGSFLTNGALSGTFGGAPFSSLAGAPISITDSITGLSVAPTLNTVVSSITSIDSQTWKTGLNGAVSAMGSTEGFTDAMTSAWNNLPDTMSSGALFDAVGGFDPSVNSALTSITGSTSINNPLEYATTWAGQTIGGSGTLSGGVLSGDPKKFGTILSQAQSYVGSANQMINGALNSDSFAPTFTSLNSIASGSLTDVNLNTEEFGAEIAKLGATVDFKGVQNIGSPGQLLANMKGQGTLGPMYSKVANIVVDERTAQSLGANIPAGSGSQSLGNIGVDLNSIASVGSNLPAPVQKQIYSALGELTDTEVGQVKSILRNTQDVVTKGTDLLDPKKLFPTTFETLTAPKRTASMAVRAIYENNSGSVNDQFNNLGQNLSGIVPDDVAVANGALALSLGQVKGISATDADSLGTALTNMETLKDLDQLEDQETYVDPAVKTYWTDTYGGADDTGVEFATGNSGQLVLSDVIGFAAGYNSAAPLSQNVTLLQQLEDNGDLDSFSGSTGVYNTITKFCAGDFGPVESPPSSGTFVLTIPVGYVGEGIYSGSDSDAVFEDAWINGVIPAVRTLGNAFSSNSTAQLVNRNSKRLNEQLYREYKNQERIDNADLTAIRASDDVAINFALNLPNLGLETEEGAAGELLERIVDFSSKGGQSVIASMREGRNLQRLGNANIQQDATVDTTGVESAGTISGGKYSSSEAKNKLIKS